MTGRWRIVLLGLALACLGALVVLLVRGGDGDISSAPPERSTATASADRDDDAATASPDSALRSALPGRPGELLQAEPFSRGMPEGSRAWRIRYTTTRADGVPAQATGLVIAGAADIGQPAPVVGWAHGTSGYAEECAPSEAPEPLRAGGALAVQQVLERGWVFVATDYVGLGTPGPHPYLIGEGEAPSVLDAVRAARSLPELSLSDETVLWGHSQGGHAALWAAQIQPRYAPDVPLAGVAAMAPASNLPDLIEGVTGTPGGTIFAAYVLAAYSATYDDVDIGDYLDPETVSGVETLATRCLVGGEAMLALAESTTLGDSIFDRAADTGALGRRLAENVPQGPLDAPVLLAQGEQDQVVAPPVQADYVRGRCAEGVDLQYLTYPGRGHLSLVAPGSELASDLLGWTQARFAGQTTTSTCAPG